MEHSEAIYRPHEDGGRKTQLVFFTAPDSWGGLFWDLLGPRTAVLPLSSSLIFSPFPPHTNRAAEGDVLPL